MKITLYILTHKKFNEEYDESIYAPILNGSALQNEDFGYIRDDTGQNISKLNPYYAELTGEYWAWKNSDSDIIGFCHYRRYFAKSLFDLEKLDENDILSDLSNNDIILPQKRNNEMGMLEQIEYSHIHYNTIHKKEDYLLVRDIISYKYPDYLKYFDEVMENNFIYFLNMFICKKELADEYFEWLFTIFEEFKLKNDFTQYDDEKRIFGYLSERLLNVYVKKNELKIKERPIYLTDVKFPRLAIAENKSRLVQKILKPLLMIKSKFNL